MWQLLPSGYGHRRGPDALAEIHGPVESGADGVVPVDQRPGHFLLAPLFAALWTWLDRRGINPSIADQDGPGCPPHEPVLGRHDRRRRPGKPADHGTCEDPAAEQMKVNEAGQLSAQEEGKLEPYHAGRLTLRRADRRRCT